MASLVYERENCDAERSKSTLNAVVELTAEALKKFGVGSPQEKKKSKGPIKPTQGLIICPCYTTRINAKRKMSGSSTNRGGLVSILISRDGLCFSFELNELVSRIPFILRLRNVLN